MTEFLETFSENGEPGRLVERSLTHQLGLWHRVSNVFLFRSSGELVVQRRHDSKDIYPGAWDLSVAEHLKPGETYESGAERGLGEELGLSDVALKPASKETRSKLEIPELGIKDFEFRVCFCAESDAELTPQASEVAEIKFFRPDALKAAMARNPNDFTPWFRECTVEVGLFE